MKLTWFCAIAAAFCLAGHGAFAAAPPLPASPPVVVPRLPAGAFVQPISFVRAAFQIEDGKVWGYERGGMLACPLGRGFELEATPLKWRAGDWEMDPARVNAIFREELVLAGFLQNGAVNLFEKESSGDRYQVAAAITDLDGRFCGDYQYRQPPYNGRLRASVEWQIFDTLSRKVVKRIATSATGDEPKLQPDGVERAFFASFRENTRALLASEEFRQLVTNPSVAEAAQALPPLTFRPAQPAKRPIASAAQGVAAIFTGDGLGTGFLISSDGLLLTNHHVVGRAKYVKVRWSDGGEAVGEVLRSDARRDIALVKADPGRRAPLALRRSPPALGEAVFAIGTPLDEKFQGSVTKGVVSATRTYEGLSYIQSDVTVNAGNSGGPLTDEGGAVIGVTVSGYDISGAPVGINLFIPIDDALKALALTPAG